MSKFLILEHVRKICYEYAKSHLTYDEPIPSFDTRFPGKFNPSVRRESKKPD